MVAALDPRLLAGNLSGLHLGIRRRTSQPSVIFRQITPASARSSNSFSNEGSIIGWRFPFPFAEHHGVFAKHFQTLKRRNCPQASTDFLFQRLPERVFHRKEGILVIRIQQDQSSAPRSERDGNQADLRRRTQSFSALARRLILRSLVRTFSPCEA